MIQFNESQFNQIFPFYLLIGPDMKLERRGRSVAKIFGKEISSSFLDHFSIQRPHLDVPTFDNLALLLGQLVVIACNNSHRTLLRGQFEYLQERDQYLFIGSPWYHSIEELTDNRMTLQDFAAHDPLFDLLHVLKTQEMTNQELKDLISTINRQKKQLTKAEQKYRGIIANMHLGMIELDQKGDIINVNNSCCEMSGYSFGELKGSHASKFSFSGYILDLLINQHAFTDGSMIDAFELKVKDKEGVEKWWFVSAALLLDDDGKVSGAFGIQLDITDSKNLQIELISAKNAAEASTRAKEQFLANMSHEIRTPLNAILGMSEQVSRTSLDENQKLHVDTIQTAADNLLVIINDILDLSKIEAGKMTIERIGFDIRATLSRAVQVLRHRAEEKGLSFQILDIDSRIAPVLIGDPFRINQVLLNLLTNAIKFTPKGSVSLSCSLLGVEDGKQLIGIDVIDTGIGMDTEFRSVLFEKFNQEDRSITRKYGGTGLGMSICKELLELMEGSIAIESEKGRGTRVSISLLLEEGQQSDLPQKVQLAEGNPSLGGKKILLVDDNAFNRLVALTMLKKHGLEIIEAVDGAQAVQLLQEQTFDLVLMDVQMPVLDGLEATRIIRSDLSSSLPVIALTANAFKSDNEQCIEAGMNDFLAKPFNEKDLLQVIGYWIGRSSPGN